VTFNGANSYDPDGNSLTYAWNFGDGTTATGALVTHTYQLAGMYTVTLTVSDGQSTDSDTTTVVVTPVSVPNLPPLAKAGAPQTIKPGAPVTLSGAGCTDPDGDPLSYQWQFGDGATGSGMTVTHVYTTPGFYTVTLTVSDGHASTSDSTLVTVATTGGASGLFDTFARPNSSTLGNGWVEVVGDLRVDQQELKTATLKGLHLAIVPTLSGATQQVAGDFASVDNNAAPRFGVVLRYQDPLNYYVMYRQVGGSSMLRIAKVVKGQETILASTTLTNPLKDTFFRVGGTATGTTLTLDLDGVTELTATDATFASGVPGIALETLFGPLSAPSYPIDNVSVTVQ
ncbi:MAG: PKD domain-containing protein, partial [Candidatus Binatia bacterium]